MQHSEVCGKYTPGTRIGCTAKATPTYASQNGWAYVKNHPKIKTRLGKAFGIGLGALNDKGYRLVTCGCPLSDNCLTTD